MQKQGRNERMQEDYPTFAEYTADVEYSFEFLHLLPCFCKLFGPSLLEMKFSGNFFPSFSSVLGVSKPTSK